MAWCCHPCCYGIMQDSVDPPRPPVHNHGAIGIPWQTAASITEEQRAKHSTACGVFITNGENMIQAVNHGDTGCERVQKDSPQCGAPQRPPLRECPSFLIIFASCACVVLPFCASYCRRTYMHTEQSCASCIIFQPSF